MATVRRPKLDTAMSLMERERKDNPAKYPGGKKQAQAIAYSKAGVRRRTPRKG